MQTFAENKQSDFVIGLLAERTRLGLSQAFGRTFSLWTDSYPDCLDDREERAHLRMLVNDVLEDASIFPGPRALRLEGDSRLLVVPIVQRGAVSAVALAVFHDCESSHWLITTARLVMENIQFRDEIERKRQENEEHLVQATQALEELTFLRSIAEYMDVSDVSNDVWSLARRVLPSLRHSIQAEHVALVAASDEGDLPEPGEPILQDGQPMLTVEECRQLVRRYHRQARDAPLVTNRLHGLKAADGAAVRNLIVVTLIKSGRTLAWLMAVNRCGAPRVDETRWALSQHEFGTSEASLVESAASVLTTHAVNTELIQDKESLVANVVRTLVSTIESKDEYTRGHSERVALYAKCLAQQLGLDEEFCQELYLTGLVHDVGKIGVSDAILQKVTQLTEEEFEEIKRHPDEGWSILQDLKQLSYVLPGVLHHHEQFDGRGYPDGLRGTQIPLAGRIMAVADAFDAMTSHRPYRRGMSQARAEEILRDGAGTQWDPEVIDAFFAAQEQITKLRRQYKAVPRRERRKRPQIHDESSEVVDKSETVEVCA